MEEHERKVGNLILSVAQGMLTPKQLRRAVEAGKADAKRLGPRIEQTALEALAAGQEALECVEETEARLSQGDL